MNPSLRLAILLAALSLGAAASAAITLSFDVTSVAKAPGESFSVLGTVMNTGPQTAFIDGSTITITPMDDFTVDDFPLLLAAPVSGLGPNESFSGGIDLTIGGGVPDGSYHFEYSILGHFDDLSTFDVPASFDMRVQSVPEPASILMVLGGAGILAAETRMIALTFLLGESLRVMDSATVEAAGGRGVAHVEAAEAIDRSSIEREFELFNASAAPVTVRRLKTSCGCESATLVYEGKPVETATVPPGRFVVARVAVRLTRNDWMNKQAQVTVLGDDESKPLAALTIDVRQHWFNLSRGRLDLNAAPSGEFSLAVSSDLPKEVAFAPPVTDAPWVHVRELASSRGSKGETLRRFAVTGDGPLVPGRYQAPVRFDVPQGASPEAQAMRRLSVFVVKEVVNDLEAAPTVVRFPAPPATGARQVVVWSTTKGALETLKADGLPPGIAIDLGKVLTMGGAKPRYMRVIALLKSSGSLVNKGEIVFRTNGGSKATVRVQG